MQCYDLPITVPPYQTVPSFTNALGILYAHDSEIANRWVANNCINLVFLEREKDIGASFLHIQPTYAAENCCLLETYRIPIDIHSDISFGITQWIKKEYYVVCSLDCYYLSCYHTVTHFVHPVLLWGFDDKQKIFKIADHINGKYEFGRIGYNEFNKSMISANDEFVKLNYYKGINLYKYSKKENYSTEIEIIDSHLKDHLESRTCINYPTLLDEFSNQNKFTCGINALYRLEYYIRNNQELELIRLMHEYLVHAQIIKLSLEKTIDNKLSEDVNDFIVECELAQNKYIKDVLRGLHRDTQYLNRAIEREVDLVKNWKRSIKRKGN